MKKYFFQMLLCFGLLLTLAGCAHTQSPSGTDADTVTKTPVPTATPAPPTSTPTPPIAPPEAEKMAAYEEMAEGCELPIISIYTRDGAEVLSLDEYVECVVDVFNCEDDFILNEITAGIKVRGNSSAHYGDVSKIRKYKAPYRIKFEEKQSMLGLNDNAECKSWVLLKANWNLLAEDVAFRMGRLLQDGHAFCSDSTFVHVYINEEFHGIYLLCEQCQVHPDRVDIHEPEDGYTGTDIGYYMEIDNYAWDDPDHPYFVQNYAYGSMTDIEGVTREFAAADYSIKNDLYSDEQVTFIRNYMNNLFMALYDACINDRYMTLDADGNLVASDYTSSYEVADALLDIESVVNMYILHEIVHSNDCGEGSFFMCIDFSAESTCPKLQFTSPWDFNWGYDGAPAGQYYAGAFCSEDFMNNFGDRSNPWFVLLMGEDWFVDMVREKWTSLQTDGLIRACVEYDEAYLRSHEEELALAGDGYVENAYALVEWLYARIDWLDDEWLVE